MFFLCDEEKHLSFSLLLMKHDFCLSVLTKLFLAFVYDFVSRTIIISFVVLPITVCCFSMCFAVDCIKRSFKFDRLF